MESAYAAGLAFALFFMIFSFAMAIVIIVANWKIYRKAGYEGWESIIPFYNIYILLKIVGKPGWWLAMYFIPVVNIVFAIWTVNMLSKSFGKEEGYTVGLVLLPFIFYPMLGFGSAQYMGPYGDPELFQQYQNRMKFDVESDETWKR